MKSRKIVVSVLAFLVSVFPLATLADGWSLTNISSFNLPSQTITSIISNLVLWLLFIFGFLGILGFVISGIMYLISAGDDDMIKKAKKTMTYSIIGVVVGLAGYVLIQAIESILNAEAGDI